LKGECTGLLDFEFVFEQELFVVYENSGFFTANYGMEKECGPVS
jgi:hypothetical protein